MSIVIQLIVKIIFPFLQNQDSEKFQNEYFSYFDRYKCHIICKTPGVPAQTKIATKFS